MDIEEKRKKWRDAYYKRDRAALCEYRKKYRATLMGKIATEKAIKKYESLHPKSRSAWSICSKIGKKPCVICGKENTDKHHPDINKPLEFIYLCRYHHKQVHLKYNHLND